MSCRLRMGGIGWPGSSRWNLREDAMRGRYRMVGCFGKLRHDRAPWKFFGRPAHWDVVRLGLAPAAVAV